MQPSNSPAIARMNLHCTYLGGSSWDYTVQHNTLGTVSIGSSDDLIITSSGLFLENYTSVKFAFIRNGSNAYGMLQNLTTNEIRLESGLGIAANDVVLVEIEVFNANYTNPLTP